MSESTENFEMLVDFITGREIPNIGSEENRQAIERFLVTSGGYEKEDIVVDADMELLIAGKPYRSQIDLIVNVAGRRFMAIKCAASSLGSWEREIVAAARIMNDYQIPYSVVSDGSRAMILDTLTGRKVAEGMDRIPTAAQAHEMVKTMTFTAYPEERLEREKLIFRSYDIMNVNVGRNLEQAERI